MAVEYRLARFNRTWWVILIAMIILYFAANLWPPEWLLRTLSIRLTWLDIFSFVVLLSCLVLSCVSTVMVQAKRNEYPRMNPFTALFRFLKYRKSRPLLPLTLKPGDGGE